MTVLPWVNMLVRSARIERFREAIREAVRPGDRVLDIGTGLGTYAFFAAREGATEVVAVDSKRIVHVAEALARANAMESVRFVKGMVPGVHLEGRFDVVIFEDYPTHLLDATTHALLRHIESELLKPGGRLLPGAASLSLAPVSSAEEHAISFPLEDPDTPRFGLTFDELQPLLRNTGRQAYMTTGALAGPAVTGPRMELIPAPGASALSIGGSWTFAENTVVHGLLLWFELELTPERVVSNRPADRVEPWGQWFLPLDPPLPVEANAPLAASVSRESEEHGAPGWSVWTVESPAGTRRGHEFAGVPLGREDLLEGA